MELTLDFFFFKSIEDFAVLASLAGKQRFVLPATQQNLQDEMLKLGEL